MMLPEQRAELLDELIQAYYEANPITICDGITGDGMEINSRRVRWDGLTLIQQTATVQKFHRQFEFALPIIERLLAERAVPDASSAAQNRTDPVMKDRLARVIRDAYMAGVADCGRGDENSDAYVYHNIDDDLNGLFPGDVPVTPVADQVERTAIALLAADSFQPGDFRNWDTLPDDGYAHPPIRGRNAYREMARAALALAGCGSERMHLQEFADLFHKAWGFWAAQDGATWKEQQHLLRALDNTLWSEMILKWGDMEAAGVITNPGFEETDQEIDRVKNSPDYMLPEHLQNPTEAAAAGDNNWLDAALNGVGAELAYIHNGKRGPSSPHWYKEPPPERMFKAAIHVRQGQAGGEGYWVTEYRGTGATRREAVLSAVAKAREVKGDG